MNIRSSQTLTNKSRSIVRAVIDMFEFEYMPAAQIRDSQSTALCLLASAFKVNLRSKPPQFHNLLLKTIIISRATLLRELYRVLQHILFDSILFHVEPLPPATIVLTTLYGVAYLKFQSCQRYGLFIT